MRESQSWNTLGVCSTFAERDHRSRNLCFQQLDCFVLNHEVRVTHHILAGASKVDDGFGGGAFVSPRVDVGHDIVAKLPFVFGGEGEVFVGDLEVCFHLVDLFVGDFEAAGLLGLCDGEPDLAPGGELVARRPYFAHLWRCVSRGEGGGVGVVGAG